ncbi:LysR family transcriptional regulator [Luteolibacter flavescens]|uniref:LysR family transcriptional regulator n=1 Tax=Luteolibacter flavescens TaxID=1859460 RepID=A0ABT3FK23_9BACT|nr:LysR family transcriptional regulator [Luteolibacter flavescens]MCW1883709.1 LysR family transcriptional regulator [Luteolibacter flavescens]
MNVHHLELFYYVAKFGGITAAVRSMPYGIQQPSVSAQICRLEKELGVTLFIRRPFSLTPEGEILFDRIQPFFTQLPDLADEIRQEGSLHLKLGACPSVLRHHLPGLMLAMKSKKPGLRISLREIQMDEIADHLVKQIADISVGAVIGAFPPPLRMDELLRVPLALLVPDDFPCTTWKQVLSRHKRKDGSLDLPLIAPPVQSVITRRFREGLTAAGLIWETEVEVGNFDVIRDYVKHGFGVGMSVMIPGVQVTGGLRQIPIREFAPVQVVAVYLREPKPVVSWFVNELKGYVRMLIEQTTAGAAAPAKKNVTATRGRGHVAKG